MNEAEHEMSVEEFQTKIMEPAMQAADLVFWRIFWEAIAEHST